MMYRVGMALAALGFTISVFGLGFLVGVNS